MLYSGKQALCQSDTIAVQELFGSGLALSGAPRQLSQRESHWHVGQLSSGRAKPDITQKIVPCYRGQQLRNHVPCQAVASLGSRALLFPDRVSFARPAWAWPTRQCLSLWERWHAAGVTERASQLRQSRRTAMRRLFCQSDTIAVFLFCLSILALSGAPRQLSQRESLRRRKASSL